MRTTRRLPELLVAVVLATALSGCGSPPAERFYTVTGEVAAPDPGTASQRLVVSPIVIPALIDRPQLVVRTSGHEVAVLENHRWAEPLSVDLARALARDLRRVRPELDVEAEGAAQAAEPDRILEVTIKELVTGPGANTSLRASWVLRDDARPCVYEGSFGATIPTPAGYAAIPAAYAEAVSRLAEAIGRTITEGCVKKTKSGA